MKLSPLLVLTSVLLWQGSQGRAADPVAPKPSEKVKSADAMTTPDELAAAFEKDPKAAEKKYLVKQEDVKNTAPLTVYGTVQSINGTEVILKTTSKVSVVVKARRVSESKALAPSRFGTPVKMVLVQGHVTKFDGKTIVIECNTATILEQLKLPNKNDPFFSLGG